MEGDLKILKVEYLSNCLLDHTKILNLRLYDQTIFCKLKILKVECLTNHLLDQWSEATRRPIPP
jgi:hypothetical protein